MKSTSNKFTDQALWSYLDGEADAALEAEIEEDFEAVARADQLIRERQRPIQPLRAPDTISSIELGAYHLGVLPKKRARVVETYLKQHPGRVAELGLLDSYLAELEDELPQPQEVAVLEKTAKSAGLLEQVKVLIADLIAGPGLRPTMAGIRDSSAQIFLDDSETDFTYRVDEIDITLQVLEDNEEPEERILDGAIEVEDTNGFTVQLFGSNQLTPLAVSEVDEDGYFELPLPNLAGLHPYELIITGPNVEIHIQTLTI